MATITTRERTMSLTPNLDDLLRQGYRDMNREIGDGVWRVMENNDSGVIYDGRQDKIIHRYKFEIWQRGQR